MFVRRIDSFSYLRDVPSVSTTNSVRIDLNLQKMRNCACEVMNGLSDQGLHCFQMHKHYPGEFLSFDFKSISVYFQSSIFILLNSYHAERDPNVKCQQLGSR